MKDHLFDHLAKFQIKIIEVDIKAAHALHHQYMGQNITYPDFPNRETVVPPTRRAFLGPYTSHIVRAT